MRAERPKEEPKQVSFLHVIRLCCSVVLSNMQALDSDAGGRVRKERIRDEDREECREGVLQVVLPHDQRTAVQACSSVDERELQSRAAAQAVLLRVHRAAHILGLPSFLRRLFDIIVTRRHHHVRPSSLVPILILILVRVLVVSVGVRCRHLDSASHGPRIGALVGIVGEVKAVERE